MKIDNDNYNIVARKEVEEKGINYQDLFELQWIYLEYTVIHVVIMIGSLARMRYTQISELKSIPGYQTQAST